MGEATHYSRRLDKGAPEQGGKFYRAYEGSAWLLKTFLCTEEMQRQRGDAKVLSVARYVSRKSDYVMAGFPLESLPKFLIGYSQAQTLDGGDIVADIPSPFGPDTTQEQITTDFNQWREDCQKKEAGNNGDDGGKKKRDAREHGGPLSPSNAAVLARSGMFAILAQVLSYPAERATPQENADFISQLKQQVASLL